MVERRERKMKIVHNKRFRHSTGYNYLQLAGDGQRWRVTNGLVQTCGSQRYCEYYKTSEEALKNYNYWLEHYTTPGRY